MRVKIEAQSQEEFDEKRPMLLKAIGGSKLTVEVQAKAHSRYDRERPVTEPRQPYFKAQAEVLAYHDEKFREMLDSIKREVGEILG